ncbi:MAG: histidine kinase, partial [Algicola sp.]|nr:histidine kinase [Algicola sp.]
MDQYFGTGLNRFDRKTETFVRYRYNPSDKHSLASDDVWAMYEDSKGKLWLGTNAGLSQFDANLGTLESYRHQVADPDSLSNDIVRSIFQDTKGTFWIGSYGGGLNKFDIYNQQFTHIKHSVDKPNSLSHNVVMSIIEDSQGTLWFGTYGGGLNKLDNQTGAYIHYRHDVANPHSISSDAVNCVYEDSKGRIWVGTLNGGLNRLDRQSNQFIHYRNEKDNPHSLSSNAINRIFEDSKGRLWVALASGGLNRLDAGTDRFVHYRPRKNNPNSISSEYVTAIYEDKYNQGGRGEIWIGSAGGVSRLAPETGLFHSYAVDPSKPGSLSHSLITFIHGDSANRIWVGTQGGGLNLYDATTDSFRHFRTSDGLSNDSVNGMLEDSSGQIWLSTNRGLDRFDPNSEHFTHYGVSDGLQSEEFNVLAYARRANGEMLFGGINGFNRFYPANIIDEQTQPTIVLTDFRLFNQSVPIGRQTAGQSGLFTLEKSIDHLQSLTIGYQHRLISFKFAALGFNNPEQAEYAYSLGKRERNSNWIYTGADNRRATFTNLSMGTHTLRVKARSKNGQWGDNERVLQIIVTPPWYKTWTAHFIYAVLFVGFIYSAYRLRANALIKRTAELEQGVVERTATINRLMMQKERMFANISHEFKTPLTLILNPLATILPSQS